ncbi:MAG: isoleucine--tRNA ligase [Treponema sp.]|uniref:isoleucine--tRNA ligase n=1 Tax=Treponema sp. TaxID=166 RepID=UPI001B459779|nr:isoleucine--tRNA ligase [Treponema sp.]MBP5402480.1 isoleucine--tRNA ligase [Treponema sp.]MBR5933100.1 isoleucine--tRNA ligase [Treponema sp.]
MYKNVDPKTDFPKQEEEILKFWEKNDTFKKSLSQREGAEDFIFYDGPPFATGLPHFGHFIPSTIKDIIPRYQTMKGKRVERRFGWDCHGLPVENLIEKELGLNSKHEIENYGIDKFNEACQASVLKYTSEWRKTITRMGRWVDFDNDYKTMNPEFMESIWWVAKSLWDKGLIYEGKYILPYCPRCSTVLSTHELAQGYKDVQDQTVTVRFKITKAPDGVKDPDMTNGKTYFLAWTTTPWTLPSNLGLCMGPEVDYVKILDKESGDFYIFAEARLSAYYKNEADYEIIYRHKGKDFIGAEYEPLFPYFAQLKDPKVCEEMSGQKCEKGAFRMFNAEYVSTEDGTGIVHIAPAFGEEDNKVFRGSGVPNVEPIDAECKFTKEVSDYQGMFVKDADKDIMKRLKDEGKLVKRDSIVHSYPHCWRCGSPLIYRGIGSWFVKVADYHDVLLRANSQITWQPSHIKEGRFGKWLAGARDWAVSRNRYWGNPIPIWRCDDPDCKHTLCVGSRDELKALSGTYPEDLHKQFVDKITFTCPKCKKGTMRRIPEVFDCWFESGSMPYAQQHYPFENKEYFEKNFPADFISEGLDQTRGWFYTLTVLASQLFDKPAFKNCIVNGIVLASDGRKMSKSLRNYTDPVEAINKFGADAIRLFLMHSAVVKADEIRYSDEGVRDVLKSIIIPLWNSYSFFVTYANIDKITCTGHEFDSKLPSNPLDRWLLSVTQTLVKKVTEAMGQYDLSGAIDPIVDFIDQLNNWYIRRSRRRFWKSENDSDKKEAYEALYISLKTFAKVAAPFVPFITEEIWQNLKTDEDKESVHLEDYPVYNEKFHDEKLEFKMATVQKAISMGRSLRNQFNLKNRQPLASVALVTRKAEEKTVLQEMLDSIKEELNVKNVIFHEREDELVEYKAKANFKVLGKELGSLMKEAAGQIASLANNAIQSILDGSKFTIEVGGKSFDLTEDKIIVDRIEKEDVKVINEGTLTVGLDTKITDELKKEGYVRDLVRGIQALRKDSGFEVTDRIKLTVGGDAELEAAYTMFEDFIKNETLAVSAAFDAGVKGTDVEADDKKWSIKIEKN